MKKILIVEDDTEIGNAIEEILKAERYSVLRAYSGTEALMVVDAKKPDLVILDLNLPGLSGEDVLNNIKHKVPVVILSAKSSVNDKIDNLLAGASDYITKPFNNGELLARINVQLRNSKKKDDVLYYKDLVLNKQNYSVTASGNAVKLTKTEFAILALFLENPKNVFSKNSILDNISEFTFDGEISSISVHISSLRHKLKEASDKDYIETIWGFGFKLIN